MSTPEIKPAGDASLLIALAEAIIDRDDRERDMGGWAGDAEEALLLWRLGTCLSCNGQSASNCEVCNGSGLGKLQFIDREQL